MKIWGLTDKGKRRSENQDVFRIMSDENHNRGVFVVCDGMGGANAGQLASSIAIESFFTYLSKHLKNNMTSRNIQKTLKEAVKFSNEAVYQKSIEKTEFNGMGTTLVGGVIQGSSLHIVNVGDSRAYMIDSDGIERITHDHSLVEELLSHGDITGEQAKNYPNKNLITRALGVEEHVVPDIFSLHVDPSKIILLCSDGLSNMLSEQEILFEILHSGDIDHACSRLITAANNHGGLDNITVVICQLQEAQ